MITETWVVYPWYRSEAADSTKSLLLANPNTAGWHEFGLEWKEHIAWIAPLLATGVAFAVTYQPFARRVPNPLDAGSDVNREPVTALIPATVGDRRSRRIRRGDAVS